MEESATPPAVCSSAERIERARSSLPASHRECFCDCRSNMVQIEIGDESKRSVQLVKFGLHTTVYISLVFNSALSMQWAVRVLTRRKILVGINQDIWINGNRKRGKVSSLFKNLRRLLYLLRSIIKERLCSV